MLLEFNIENQELTCDDDLFLVNKSNNYLELKFNFNTEDWEDTIRFCLLKNSKRRTYQFGIESDGTVIVPATILTGKKFYVSVYGAKDSERITTNVLVVRLQESGYTTDLSSITPVERDIFVTIFEELDKKLNITDVDTELDINSTNPVENRVVTGALNAKSDLEHTHSIIDLTDFPVLANVATSGDYTDLSNKPTIISLGGNVTVTKQTNADEGYLVTYIVKQGGVQVGEKINVPMDYLLKSVSLETCTVPDEPEQGYKVGDKYFDFVFNVKSGSVSDTHIYLLANDFVDVYYADESTITKSNNTFSVKTGGITTTQLASGVVTSLGYADAFNQSVAKNITSNDIAAWNGKQTTNNLVTSWSSTLSDTKYPSEKLVKEYVDNLIGNIEEDMLE